jgi:hypothetical protein
MPRKPDDLRHSHPLRVLSQHGTFDGFVSREKFLQTRLTKEDSTLVEVNPSASETAISFQAPRRQSKPPVRRRRQESISAFFCIQSCCVRGVVLWANHYSRRLRRRVSKREHVFPTVHPNFEMALPSLRARSGRAKPQPSLPTARKSPNAPQSSGYRANAIRPSMPSSSSSMRSAVVAVFERRYGQFNFTVTAKHRRSEPSSDRCLTNLADTPDVRAEESKLNYPYLDRSAA